jgi:D-xylose transport system permease protein
MSTMLDDPRLIAEQPGLTGALTGFRRRLSQGELGSLPVIVGLIIIWAVFQSQNPNFLTARNLTNLMLQIAAMGTISTGIVLVLLLGEIDLSAGAVSGLCAAVMAVLNVKAGVPAAAAIGAAIAVGLIIGLLHGFLFTRFRVPSFVVTLAGQIGWQGALLYVLGETGTVNLTDRSIVGVANTFLPPIVGWLLAVVCIALYLVSVLQVRRRRQAAGLQVDPLSSSAGQIVAVVGGVLLAVAVLNSDRGVPSAVLILLSLIVLLDYVTRRTRFGRHIFAVGGNAEAARRAGIQVDTIRLAVFALASGLAACGGILAASRLLAVNQSSGGSDLLLNAIAAAVIGGTSLFGGRGSVWAALLGALVIGSISNGMDLLALASSVKFMITGAVLLAAVTIDALSRRGRQSAGRA